MSCAWRVKESVEFLLASFSANTDARNLSIPKSFSMTIKKKEHSVYGSFYKEPVAGKAKKITFD